jgi:4-carboxymuconolactone decarboxylase
VSPGGDRHETGLRALEALGGPDAAAPILAAADIAPDLVRFAIDFAFGEVLSRPGPAALKHHLRATLAAGATRAQIVLVLEQMAIYAGFPAALNGVAAAREVFAESA